VDASPVAEYCRAVEAHLTKINGGHLVRVVGPGFALVRQWHDEGIPLSVVQRAIEQKSDRQRRASTSRTPRPLRIEFCEDDVRALFEDWKRAVGVTRENPVNHVNPVNPVNPANPVNAVNLANVANAANRPSLSKHLERVSERLARLLGRQDLTEDFLSRVNDTIAAVADARAQAARARGAAREPIVRALQTLDRPLVDAAWASMSTPDRAAIDALAQQELGAFRQRLSPAEWQRALAATRDRLVREKFALPVIEVESEG